MMNNNEKILESADIKLLKKEYDQAVKAKRLEDSFKISVRICEVAPSIEAYNEMCSSYVLLIDAPKMRSAVFSFLAERIKRYKSPETVSCLLFLKEWTEEERYNEPMSYDIYKKWKSLFNAGVHPATMFVLALSLQKMDDSVLLSKPKVSNAKRKAHEILEKIIQSCKKEKMEGCDCLPIAVQQLIINVLQTDSSPDEAFKLISKYKKFLLENATAWEALLFDIAKECKDFRQRKFRGIAKEFFLKELELYSKPEIYKNRRKCIFCASLEKIFLRDALHVEIICCYIDFLIKIDKVDEAVQYYEQYKNTIFENLNHSSTHSLPVCFQRAKCYNESNETALAFINYWKFTGSHSDPLRAYGKLLNLLFENAFAENKIELALHYLKRFAENIFKFLNFPNTSSNDLYIRRNYWIMDDDAGWDHIYEHLPDEGLFPSWGGFGIAADELLANASPEERIVVGWHLFFSEPWEALHSVMLPAVEELIFNPEKQIEPWCIQFFMFHLYTSMSPYPKRDKHLQAWIGCAGKVLSLLRKVMSDCHGDVLLDYISSLRPYRKSFLLSKNLYLFRASYPFFVDLCYLAMHHENNRELAEECVECLEELKNIEPNYYTHLGVCYGMLGNNNDAIIAYRSAIANKEVPVARTQTPDEAVVDLLIEQNSIVDALEIIEDRYNWDEILASEPEKLREKLRAGKIRIPKPNAMLAYAFNLFNQGYLQKANICVEKVKTLYDKKVFGYELNSSLNPFLMLGKIENPSLLELLNSECERNSEKFSFNAKIHQYDVRFYFTILETYKGIRNDNVCLQPKQKEQIKLILKINNLISSGDIDGLIKIINSDSYARGKFFPKYRRALDVEKPLEETWLQLFEVRYKIRLLEFISNLQVNDEVQAPIEDLDCLSTIHVGLMDAIYKVNLPLLEAEELRLDEKLEKEKLVINAKLEERDRVFANLAHSIKNLISSVQSPLRNIAAEENLDLTKKRRIEHALRGLELIKEISFAIDHSYTGSIEDFREDACMVSDGGKSLSSIIVEALMNAALNMFYRNYFEKPSFNYFPKGDKNRKNAAFEKCQQITEKCDPDSATVWLNEYLLDFKLDVDEAAEFAFKNTKNSALKFIVMSQEIMLNALKYSSYVPRDERFLSVSLKTSGGNVVFQVKNSMQPSNREKTTGNGRVVIARFAKLLGTEPEIVRSEEKKTYNLKIAFENFWRHANDVKEYSENKTPVELRMVSEKSNEYKLREDGS